MENLRYIYGHRTIDRRSVYFSTDLSEAQSVRLVDTLLDCEFRVAKIEEEDYIWAVDNYNWVYVLNNENFDKFEQFLKTNYIKLIENQKPKLLE